MKMIKTKNKLFAIKKKDNQTMQALPNSIICLDIELIEKLDNPRKNISYNNSIQFKFKLIFSKKQKRKEYIDIYIVTYYLFRVDEKNTKIV